MAVQLSFPPCSCLLFACLVLSETFTKFLAEEPNSAAGGALYLSKVLEIDEISDSLNHFNQSISYWIILNINIHYTLSMEVHMDFVFNSCAWKLRFECLVRSCRELHRNRTLLPYIAATFVATLYFCEWQFPCRMCLLAAAFPTGHAEELGPSRGGMAFPCHRHSSSDHFSSLHSDAKAPSQAL